MSGWLFAAAAALFWCAWALMPGVGVTDPAVIFALVSSQRSMVALSVTAPNLDRTTLVPVMAFMQGSGLLLLAPLTISFFSGAPTMAPVQKRALAAGRLCKRGRRQHGPPEPRTAQFITPLHGLVPAPRMKR